MNKDVHHRKNIRLKRYDYSQAGLYFVTVCTHNKACLFGKIINDEMVLNHCGEIVRDEWINTKNIRKNINMDQFVIMPNHIHGIIEITHRTNESPTTRRGVLHTPSEPKPMVLMIITI